MNTHCIFPELKTIFIHIPKNAGSSVRAFFFSATQSWTPETGGNPHATAKEIKAQNPREWEEFFKFCILRDPLERFASAYHYFIRRADEWEDASSREDGKKRWDERGDRSDYEIGKKLREFTLQEFTRTPHMFNLLHFQTQKSFTSEDIDFFATMENLEEDMKTICEATKLKYPTFEDTPTARHGADEAVFPKANSNNMTYSLDWNAESVIREAYKEDFELYERIISQQ